ncbi:hypothetical protein BC628DRAFT_1373277 [Trametes gibbosa]|nr:hypothetical protein BC628DRAFT_1373277 [Trametes gibbosa]
MWCRPRCCSATWVSSTLTTISAITFGRVISSGRCMNLIHLRAGHLRRVQTPRGPLYACVKSRIMAMGDTGLISI